MGGGPAEQGPPGPLAPGSSPPPSLPAQPTQQHGLPRKACGLWGGKEERRGPGPLATGKGVSK